MATTNNVTDYDKIIEKLFFNKFNNSKKMTELEFSKDEIVSIGKKLRLNIRNVPDIVYTYRSRRDLPKSIRDKGNWAINPKGKGKFSFIKLNRSPFVIIQEGLSKIKILNSLPEIVEKYSSNDEQSLLSNLRYNRLLDIFTGITCFHLQSHVRCTVRGEGQIEIDDLYVGINKEGREYIIPVEAKSVEDRDKLGWVQITNLVKFAHQYYPKLKCLPIAVKPGSRSLIYLIEFDESIDFNKIAIKNIKLYHLIRIKEKDRLD